MLAIHSDMAEIKTGFSKAGQYLFPKLVVTNAAYDHPSTTQCLGVIGKIRRCAAKSFTVWEKVP